MWRRATSWAAVAVAAAVSVTGAGAFEQGHLDRLLRTKACPQCDLERAEIGIARWDELEKRCLSCGNCTMACPTCFCSKIEDSMDLSGEHAERTRSWDSCFTMDFSYIHGDSVRSSTKSRYRQWLMHKLATWIDQFGSSGCVGCGRCITWCPVGIDLTEEVKAIRDSEKEPKHG